MPEPMAPSLPSSPVLALTYVDAHAHTILSHVPTLTHGNALADTLFTCM
jgi:hypothetical protein